MSSKGVPVVLESKQILNEFIKVRKDTLQFGSEKPFPYFVLETIPQSTMVLVTSATGEFLVVKEYRHPVKAFVLSAPGGYLEKDEHPIDAAKRELLEETGYTAEHFQIGGITYPLPGIYTHTTTFVFGQNAKKIQEPKFDQSESISCFFMTKQELQKQIQAGEHIDGILCTALYLHEHLLETFK